MRRQSREKIAPMFFEGVRDLSVGSLAPNQRVVGWNPGDDSWLDFYSRKTPSDRTNAGSLNDSSPPLTCIVGIVHETNEI